MSVGALLTAVRQRLWDANGWTRNQCDVLDEPPDTAGEMFVCIKEGDTESTEKTCLKETFRIEITVYRRTGTTPRDRMGDVQLPNIISLEETEGLVKQAIHNNHELRAIANEVARAPGIGGDIFQQPLWYLGSSKSMADDPADKKNRCWRHRTLRFGGAVRVQSVQAMK